MRYTETRLSRRMRCMRCLSYSISFPYTIEILDHHLCHLHDKKTQKNKKTFFFFCPSACDLYNEFYLCIYFNINISLLRVSPSWLCIHWKASEKSYQKPEHSLAHPKINTLYRLYALHLKSSYFFQLITLDFRRATFDLFKDVPGDIPWARA